MKKFIILFVVIFLCSLLLLTEEDDLLKINASISPKRLSRGQEGKVVLKLKLENGIVVSPKPSFIIEINPCEELIFPKNFFTASDLEIEISEENGEEYLNLKNPIDIPFTVSLEAERGNHLLEGQIKYFACSKKEAWCLKSTSKFSASLYTRNTVVKKKK